MARFASAIVVLLCACALAAAQVQDLAESKDDASLTAMEGQSHRLQKVQDNEAHGNDSPTGLKPAEEIEATATPAAKKGTPAAPPKKSVQKEDATSKPAAKAAKPAKPAAACKNHRPTARCMEWKKEGLCAKNVQVSKDCCATCK